MGLLAGLAREKLRTLISKTDGRAPSVKTIDNVFSKKRQFPDWRGQDEKKNGRPQMFTKSQDC